MRSLLIVFYITITLLILSGCTAKLASRSVEKNKVAEGLVYQLPATQLVIVISHELVNCGPYPKIRIVSATFSSNLVPDNRPEATFALDTTVLQSGSKTIPEARISMHNNILTGINYKAEDKTGEIIGKVAKIAAIAKGSPLPRVRAETSELFFGERTITTPAIPDACSVMARKALAKKLRLKQKIDAIRSTMDATYNLIQKGYVLSNKNASIHEKHIVALRTAYHKAVLHLSGEKLDNKKRAALAATVALLHKYLVTETSAFATYETAWVKGRETALTASEIILTQLIDEHTAAKTGLIANTTIKWVPIPNQRNVSKSDIYDISELYKWFNSQSANRLGQKLIGWQTNNRVKLTAKCSSSGATKIKVGLQTAVYYRVPKRCDIDVVTCKDSDCSLVGKTITLQNIPLAQYGYTASLPVTNGPFENSEYAMAFDTNTGRLNTFTFKSDKSALLEAATSIAKAQDLLKQTDIEKIDAKKIELDKEAELIDAETKLIEAEEKKLEAQKKLDAAKEK